MEEMCTVYFFFYSLNFEFQEYLSYNKSVNQRSFAGDLEAGESRCSHLLEPHPCSCSSLDGGRDGRSARTRVQTGDGEVRRSGW